MRLVTFQHRHDPPEAGILSGREIGGLGREMLSVIAAGEIKAAGPVYDVRDVKLLAPIPRPP